MKGRRGDPRRPLFFVYFFDEVLFLLFFVLGRPHDLFGREVIFFARGRILADKTETSDDERGQRQREQKPRAYRILSATAFGMKSDMNTCLTESRITMTSRARKIASMAEGMSHTIKKHRQMTAT